MTIVMLPPYAMLAGSMGAAMGGTPAPDYDPSPFGLDALTSKYGIYSPAYRVLTSYSATGNLLRLRRSTDDAEADFGAVRTTGLLDTASVTSWLGGGTGYCTTIYDQSGNGRDAVQATADNQPSLVLSGSIPSLQFDGSNDRLTAAGAVSFARNVGQASLLAVCQYPSAATKNILTVSTAASSTRATIQRTSTVFRGQGRRLDADSVVSTTGLTANTNWGVQIAGFDWANSDLYHRMEGASETNTSFQTNGVTEDTDSLGVYFGASNTISNHFDGKATLWVLTRDLLSGAAASNLVTSLAALKVT